MDAKYNGNSFLAISFIVQLVSEYPPDKATPQSLVVRRLRELACEECRSGEEQFAFVLAVMIHLRDGDKRLNAIEGINICEDEEMDEVIVNALRQYFLSSRREWGRVAEKIHKLVVKAFMGTFDSPAKQP